MHLRVACTNCTAVDGSIGTQVLSTKIQIQDHKQNVVQSLLQRSGPYTIERHEGSSLFFCWLRIAKELY
jgi:hypothetical protein